MQLGDTQYGRREQTSLRDINRTPLANFNSVTLDIVLDVVRCLSVPLSLERATHLFCEIHWFRSVTNDSNSTKIPLLLRGHLE